MDQYMQYLQTYSTYNTYSTHSTYRTDSTQSPYSTYTAFSTYHTYSIYRGVLQENPTFNIIQKRLVFFGNLVFGVSKDGNSKNQQMIPNLVNLRSYPSKLAENTVFLYF